MTQFCHSYYIWWHRSGSTLSRVMVWCIMALNHYLTNVDSSSELFCGIYPRTISQEVLKNLIQNTYLDIIFLKLLPHLSGGSNLVLICACLDRVPTLNIDKYSYWRACVTQLLWWLPNTSQWGHNEGDDVSNHQPRHCLLNLFIQAQIKENIKLRVTGLCAGNSPVTGEFSAQMASNAKNVSIWWRHLDV